MYYMEKIVKGKYEAVLKAAVNALKGEGFGILLPCNVVIQEDPEGRGISVSAVNPMEAMAAVKNEDLECVSGEVTERLKRVLASLPEQA